MCSRSGDSRGSLSAFFTCIAAALVLLSLFVFESGRYVNRYLEVSDIAENAARIGAQNVVGIREGNPQIDQRAAVAASERYLRESGLSGRVRINGLGITVSVSASWRPVGTAVFGEKTIALSRSASLFREG